MSVGSSGQQQLNVPYLSGARILKLVEHSGVHRVGEGTATSQGPGQDDDLAGTCQAGDGLRPQRVADGHVPVHREGRDGQNRGVGCHLRHERLHDAEAAAKAPGVGLPNGGHFRRKC